MHGKEKNLFYIFLFFLLISFVSGGISGAMVSGIVLTQAITARVPGISENKDATILRLDDTQEESATIDAVNTILPGVVSIIITKDLSKIYPRGIRISPFGDIFEFGGIPDSSENSLPTGKQEIGGGTGFFISKDGLILTNKHVVSDQDAEYTVVTQDGKQYEAKVLAVDIFNDIAIVKISPDKEMPVVMLGDSSGLIVGQTVIAIGNTLAEYQNSVTKGIISGIEREVIAGDLEGRAVTLEGVIQTDAAINPGNSGGPLINLAGQVVGVNTAVSREGQLIGFAIGINDAKKTIESVLKHGKIIRPFLGVRYVPITPRLQEEKALSVDYGVFIVRGEKSEDVAVVPDSPADKIGLKEHDIILEVNGIRIDRKNGLAKTLSQYNPGDVVKLKVIQDKKEKIIEVTLGET